ncbi:unnamed protein product [Nippostrongylus brasiliensis]|uniref:Ovule protein n=1 Tax=Nippostrongylus brasiliensis TaxID=27835 RepID=A0A0N4XZS9_NIPBR|nr:unnamed protein product [Nippostrongylus brasiliensis]
MYDAPFHLSFGSLTHWLPSHVLILLAFKYPFKYFPFPSVSPSDYQIHAPPSYDMLSPRILYFFTATLRTFGRKKRVVRVSQRWLHSSCTSNVFQRISSVHVNSSSTNLVVEVNVRGHGLFVKVIFVVFAQSRRSLESSAR